MTFKKESVRKAATRFAGEHPALIGCAGVLLAFVVFGCGLALGLYWWQFGGPLSDDGAIWGQFGDYVGGVVNPVIGVAGFGALLLTIVYQARELKASINELKRSAEAAEDQAEILIRSARVHGLAARLRPHMARMNEAQKSPEWKDLEEELEQLKKMLP